MQTFLSTYKNGVNFHVLPTTKYKLNTIVVTFHTDLEEGKAAMHAMIPHVLMRGTENHPTSESIQLALSDMYGATLTGGVSKKGERQLVEFLCKVVNEKYLNNSEQLLEKGIQLLSEVLFHPVQEAGGFKADFVEKEKEQHAKRIDSLLDDKIVYAAERCLEEMTKGERFSIPKLGRKSDLDTIDARNLFDTYQELMKTAPMHVYVVGNVEPERVMSLVQKYFPQDRTPKTNLLPAQTDVVPRQVKEVVDQLDVNQGKLNIGLRTKVTHSDESYPALVVYNGILGGFPHSKLFVNVREKASLAYYASSRLESYKGILYIQSGIQIEQYDKALQIIKQQLEEMKQGNLSDDELSFTKNGLINSFRTVQDSPEGLADLHTGGLVSGRQRTMEELIEAVLKVTKEEVIQIANQICLDTVYFLRDRKGVAAGA
ncbi:EF-P 5-aminopentanol modification-associated protein YfmF [Effusibacillus consociatus]|uniref:EF-P 5-aminopentanol modification-associated protein YfmF n=1 Tax=Effusibacillus consociatus TaxID=1117041 RepID=A0ABV9Q1R3_9BACL